MSLDLSYFCWNFQQGNYLEEVGEFYLTDGKYKLKNGNIKFICVNFRFPDVYSDWFTDYSI